MKKTILALALVMSMGVTQVSLASSAPKHRYHPATEQVDKQEKDADDEALELTPIQPAMIRLLPMIMKMKVLLLIIPNIAWAITMTHSISWVPSLVRVL